jgi:hypothetical protein
LAVAILAAWLGCAPPGVDLIRDGRVELRLEPSDVVEIFWVDVRRHAEVDIVSGRVDVRDSTWYPLWGHVHLSATVPGGRQVAEARSAFIYLQRPQRRTDVVSPSSFSIRLDPLPAGTTVHLAFYGSPPARPAPRREGGA